MNILLMKSAQDMDFLRTKGNREMTSSGGSITRHMSDAQKIKHYIALCDFWQSVRDNSKCEYWIKRAGHVLSMLDVEMWKLDTNYSSAAVE